MYWCYLITVLNPEFHCLAGTIFLWWTWWETKNNIDEAKKDFGTIPVLDVDLSNETAFLVFSIIASIFTVSSMGRQDREKSIKISIIDIKCMNVKVITHLPSFPIFCILNYNSFKKHLELTFWAFCADLRP